MRVVSGAGSWTIGVENAQKRIVQATTVGWSDISKRHVIAKQTDLQGVGSQVVEEVVAEVEEEVTPGSERVRKKKMLSRDIQKR